MKTLCLVVSDKKIFEKCIIIFKKLFLPRDLLRQIHGTVSKTFIGVYPEIIPVNLSQNPMNGFKETVQVKLLTHRRTDDGQWTITKAHIEDIVVR